MTLNEEVRLKEDFKLFVWKVWQHLFLPEPTFVQKDVCNYLQYGCELYHNRIMIIGFRGVGKSWLTSAYVCLVPLEKPPGEVSGGVSF